MRCRSSHFGQRTRRCIGIAAVMIAAAVPLRAQYVDVGALIAASPPLRVAYAATAGPVLLASALNADAEVAIPLFVAGFVGGPVAGYVYARDLLGAVPGALWRTGFTALSVVYLYAVLDDVSEAGLAAPVLVMFASMPVAVGALVLLSLDLTRLERRWETNSALRFAPAMVAGGAGLSILLEW